MDDWAEASKRLAETLDLLYPPVMRAAFEQVLMHHEERDYVQWCDGAPWRLVVRRVRAMRSASALSRWAMRSAKLDQSILLYDALKSAGWRLRESREFLSKHPTELRFARDLAAATTAGVCLLAVREWRRSKEIF